MADAIMLFDDHVVPIKAVSDNDTFDPLDTNMLFFPDYSYRGVSKVGRLRRFNNGKAYMSIFDADTTAFRGYYQEKGFWDNNKIEQKKDDNAAPIITLGDMFYYDQLLNLSPDTKVYFSYKFIDKFNSDFKLKVSYGYTLLRNVTSNSNLWNVDSTQTNLEIDISSFLTTYGNYVIDKKYLSYSGSSLSPLDNGQKAILYDVIYVLNEIVSDTELVNFLQSKGLYAPIQAHITLPDRYNHIFGSIEQTYHSLYNEEYFARLRLSLVEFRYWLLKDKDDYTKLDVNDLSVYIVNIFPVEELRYLDYNVKVNLLKSILRNNLWIKGNWYFNEINEEEALIKIIRSIAREDNGILNYSEIDQFLDLLNSEFDSLFGTNLYQVLYSRIQDTLLYSDDGKGNKGQLVKAVYNLWLESKFNPYHDNPTTASQALSNFHYTPYNAHWQYDDVSRTLPPILDEKAAPMILNYESEKVLLWYTDNYKFKFKRGKIQAFEETLKSYGEVTLDMTLSPILGPGSPTKYVLYGTYNIFQPIAIKASDSNDTIIKMPVKNLPQNHSPLDFIENCIPVFYMQYVDDLGDYSDAKQTIGTAIDVALTFTGIGNIAKLRHLKELSLLRGLLTGGLTAAEEVALRSALSGIAAGFNALIPVAHLAYSFATGNCTVYYNSQTPPQPTDPTYQEYNFCQEVDKWLFALEIVSLSADLLARRALQRATKRLRASIPPSSVSTDYDAIRTAVDAIDEIDDLLNLFLNRIQNTHPQVYGRITNGSFTREIQVEFMFDFHDQPHILDELNDLANIHMIDDWKEVEHLVFFRKDIKFLRSYRPVMSNSHLLEHVHTGHPKIKVKQGQQSKGAITGSHNPNILIEPTPSSLPQGKMSWKVPPPIENSNPLRPDLGYRQGTVQRNMSDLPDPATGNAFVKGDGTSIVTKRNAYFPSSYSTSRINEEMIYAYSQINISLPDKTQINSLGEYSFTYSSKASDGHSIEIVSHGVSQNPNLATVQTIYPEFF